MTKLSERDRLIEELKLQHWSCDATTGFDYSDEIANFILARDKSIVDTFTNLLSRIDSKEFIVGKDSYIQVNMNQLEEAKQVLRRTGADNG